LASGPLAWSSFGPARPSAPPASRPADPNQPLGVAKVVGGTLAMVAAGVVAYVAGQRRARA
jgi:hypothetical protein